MVFACGGGILAGAIVGSLPRPRVLIMPMVSSLYAVPLVILYPVFTVWLGIGSESKIAFASIYGFLPTMLATAAGIQTIDPQLLLAARSMGATLSQRLVRVIIPAAIPTVLSGLRVGGALVIVGVVVSEMLISSAGIGYLISRYRTILDSPHVFAGVLLVLAMAIAFNAAIKWIERKAAIWQTGSRAGQRAARRDHRRRRPACDLTESRVFDLTLTFDNGPEPGGDAARARYPARTRHQDDLLRDRREARAIPNAAGSRHGPTPKATGSAITLLRIRCRSASNAIPRRREHEIGRTQAAIGDLAHPQRWFRPFGGGGNLDDRLLKPSVVEHLTRGQATAACCGMRFRATGTIPTAGSIARWRNAASQPWSLMVLHDLPSGAMDHLERFLDRAAEAGARFASGLSARLRSDPLAARSCCPSNPTYPPSKKVSQP